MAAQKNFSRSIWLLLLNVGTEIDKFFTDIDVPVDSELLVAHRQEDDVRLTELYRVRKGYPLQEHAFGTISGRNNILNATDLDFYDRRNSLHGLIMEAATTEVSCLSSITIPSRAVKRSLKVQHFHCLSMTLNYREWQFFPYNMYYWRVLMKNNSEAP
jgi:hypothetical protein